VTLPPHPGKQLRRSAAYHPSSHTPVSEVGWLLHVHQVLPFYPMAQVIRAGLTDGLVTDVGSSFLVLGVWAVAGTAVTAWAVGRRH